MNYSSWDLTTAKMPTLEEVEHMIDDFNRRWPKSELAVAIECPPSTEQDLLAACGQMFPAKEASPFGFGDISGLRIETNMLVPYRCYVVRMQDGSKVMHYLSGLKVRCLTTEG